MRLVPDTDEPVVDHEDVPQVMLSVGSPDMYSQGVVIGVQLSAGRPRSTYARLVLDEFENEKIDFTSGAFQNSLR
jgi:hypothetical protein